MKKIIQYLPFLLFLVFAIILSIFAIYNWFNHDTIFYYWDANVPLDTKISLQTFFYPWYANKFPGLSGNGWSWLPYWGLIAVFRALFDSLSKAQFSLYLSLLIASVTGFFVLIRNLREDIFGKNNSLISVFVIPAIIAFCYAFNLYTFYYAYYMFNPQMFTIAFLPWNFLALIKLFPLFRQDELKTKSTSAWWLVLYFVTQLLMVPGFTTYVFLAQYFVFLGLYFFLYWQFSKKKFWDRQLFSFVLLLLATGIFHWAWFYSSLLGFKNLYESQKSFGVMVYLAPGSVNTHLLNLFRLIGSAMMNNNPFSWDWVYTSQSLVALPLFIFPLAIIFLCLKLKQIYGKMIILFLLTVLLASLFIMKLSNPPLAEITNFLFQYLPFFGAFRDSVQKAGLYFLLSYFLLAGFGLEAIWSLIKQKWYSILIGATGLIFATLLMTGPFFLFAKNNIRQIDYFYKGEKYTLSAKTIIPKEYYDLKQNIEPICQGRTILVAPRTSALSSAVWEKYAYSYVGQDYLLNLINCNFISTHLIQNDPDAFITSPYLMLQENDFVNFKKFLLQNQIGLVLIRKDYIPYYFTHWTKIDPIELRELLEKDGGFVKQFENDFFVLYQVKTVGTNVTYGFSLTQSMTYTNSPLKTAQDYAGLFSILPASHQSVIISKNDQIKKYRQYVDTYVAKSNCVGCVKVLPSETQEENSRLFLTKLKRIIKSILRRNSKGETEDIQISMELIDANYIFSDLMNGLDYFNEKTAKRNMQIYADRLKEILDKLRFYQGDFFSKNNKLIEARNFLIGQNSRLTQYLKPNIYQVAKFGFDKIYYVALLQQEIIDYVNAYVWETDLTSTTYNMRLDIPSSDDYTCRIDASEGFKINQVSFEGKNAPLKEIGRNVEIKSAFTSGSFPVEVIYERNKIIPEIEKLSNKDNTVFKLGELGNGAYSLQLEITSKIPTIMVMLVVDNSLQEESFPKIIRGEVTPDQTVLFQVLSTTGETQKVNSGFSLDSLEKKKYYVYLFNLSQLEPNKQNITIENFTVKKIVREQDISAFCISSGSSRKAEAEVSTVKRVNPTFYVVQLPKIKETNFLSFNQSFDPDWKAYSLKQDKKKYYEHIQNGYANAWLIDDPEVDTVYVEFDRLARVLANLYGSAAIVLVLILGFSIFYYGNNRNKKTN